MRYSFMLLAAASLLAAADLPFAGKWKLNLEKSDFQKSTITFAAAPGGQMQVTTDGMSYTFDMDGKDCPALFGGTAAWKQTGPNSWQTIHKLKGKVLSEDIRTLSADGKTLTVNSKGIKPNGEAFEDQAIYERTSGGPGLPGQWRAKQVKLSVPFQLEMEPTAHDGLHIAIGADQLTCDAQFDGKDYAITAPNIPPGMTITLVKAGARGFEMTQKFNGKPVYEAKFEVSGDGKTLTEHGSPAGVKEPYKAVYDRQ